MDKETTKHPLWAVKLFVIAMKPKAEEAISDLKVKIVLHNRRLLRKLAMTRIVTFFHAGSVTYNALLRILIYVGHVPRSARDNFPLISLLRRQLPHQGEAQANPLSFFQGIVISARQYKNI